MNYLDSLSTLSVGPLWAWVEGASAAEPGVHGHLELIITLTSGLAAALLMGYITQRLGLSPIVGYLLAGILVGPYTPGIEADAELAQQMAEIGVILLMFGVGLHFHFKELLAVRRVAVPGAVGQSLIATILGVGVGWLLGWSTAAGIVFGLAISVASTVVLLRVLSDNNDLHTPTGHIAVGWLVVEDLFTVFVLVLMPVLFGSQEQSLSSIGLAVLVAIAKIGLFVAFVMYVGGKVVPWFLTQIARTRSRELFTLTVLVIALGIAVGATKVFDVSMALGAFLAGMVVGRSEFSSRAASEALPMRDAFAVLFFVSVGMLFNPQYLMESPLLIGATLGIVLLGKPLAALVIVLALRYPLRVALSVSVALAQIGEFSFILANVGMGLKVFSTEQFNALIAAAIVSISFNPILYRLVDLLEDRAKHSPWLWNWLNARSKYAIAGPSEETDGEDDEAARQGRAVVVGYGPVGRTLVRLLQENGIEPAIIELNLETVRQLREEGIAAFYGDSAHKETQLEAGMNQSEFVILSASGLRNSQEVIRVARECNPRIRVFARATYLREIPSLTKAGADVVFTGEGEVAMTMTEFILRQLGAGGEQIERDRIRNELFGSPASLEILLPPTPRPPADEKPAEPASDAEMKVPGPAMGIANTTENDLV